MSIARPMFLYAVMLPFANVPWGVFICSLCHTVAHMSLVYVADWSRRAGAGVVLIHGRHGASSLVIRQWRSRVGRWLRQSSHSTAEQSTTATTRPRLHKLSSRVVVAGPIMLQRTHITALRSTQQRYAVAAASHRLAVQSALSNSLNRQSDYSQCDWFVGV